MGVLDWFRMQQNMQPQGGTDIIHPQVDMSDSMASGGLSGNQYGQQYPSMSDDQGVQMPVKPEAAPITSPDTYGPMQDTGPYQSGAVYSAQANPAYNTRISDTLPGIPADRPRPELDKYSQMLDQYPERPSPSWLRTFATGALSFSNAQQPDQVEDTIGPDGRVRRQIKYGEFKPMNIDQAQHVMNMPYEQQLGDYQNELKARQAGAALERQTLNDQSVAENRAFQNRSREAGITKGLRQGDINDIRNTLRARGLDIRQQDEDRKNWIALHPKGILISPRGGNYMLVDPITNEVRDTGIQTGTLTTEQELDLKNGYSLDQIEARGQQARQTKQTSSADAGATSQLPTQQRVGAQNRAGQLRAARPELAPYISIDQDGQVKVTAPNKYLPGGISQQNYDAAIDYIYGPGASQQQTQTPQAPSQAPQEPGDFVGPVQDTTQQAAPPQRPASPPANPFSASLPGVAQNSQTSDTRVIIVDPSGKKFTLPYNQVESFIKLHPNYRVSR